MKMTKMFLPTFWGKGVLKGGNGVGARVYKIKWSWDLEKIGKI